MQKLREIKGFSLIELLVVVAILGILAGISVPVYKGYTSKAKRADAKSALMENAQYMERYYTTHNTYNDILTPDPPDLPQIETQNSSYDLSLASADATSFTLQAVPKGSQVSDDCGTMTVNQLGNKTPANCW